MRCRGRAAQHCQGICGQAYYKPALQEDPLPGLLLWERYNYGQIGMAMGNKKESGLGVDRIAIFIQTYFGWSPGLNEKKNQREQVAETLLGSKNYRPELVLGRKNKKMSTLGEKISHPFIFFVILQKYYNCASRREAQWRSESIGPLYFCYQVNTCPKYIILRSKDFGWKI